MPADFKTLLEALAAEKVRYVVIGGMAAIEHGAAILTSDLDLCYERSPENLQRLAKVLAGLKVTLRGAPKDLPFRMDAETLQAGLNFTFDSVAGPVDTLGEVQGVGGFAEVDAHAIDARVYGVRVRVMGLDDLIRAKKSAGRRKDKLQLLELEDLLRIKKKGE